MTYGRKTGGRNFTVGNPGGPGRPRIPDDQKEAMKRLHKMRNESRHWWATYYEELVSMPHKELRKLVGTKEKPPDPKIPVLKLIIARSILHTLVTGKVGDLQIHRDLMCGPEPKQLELSGPDGESLSPLGKYSQEQLANAFEALNKIVKEADECKSNQNPSTLSLEQSPDLLPPSSQAQSDTE